MLLSGFPGRNYNPIPSLLPFYIEARPCDPWLPIECERSDACCFPGEWLKSRRAFFTLYFCPGWIWSIRGPEVMGPKDKRDWVLKSLVNLPPPQGVHEPKEKVSCAELLRFPAANLTLTHNLIHNSAFLHHSIALMPTVCNGGGTHCLLVGPFPTSLINSTPMFLLNWPLEGRGFRAERNFVDSSLNNFFYRLTNV